MSNALPLVLALLALAGCDKSNSKACQVARTSVQAAETSLMDATRTYESSNLELTRGQAALLAAQNLQGQAAMKSAAAATIPVMSDATATRKMEVQQAAVDAVTAVNQAKVAVEQAQVKVNNAQAALDAAKVALESARKVQVADCGQ